VLHYAYVPKVPHRMPGEQFTVIDIYNRLYRERIIFLGKDVDDEIANQIIEDAVSGFGRSR